MRKWKDNAVWPGSLSLFAGVILVMAGTSISRTGTTGLVSFLLLAVAYILFGLAGLILTYAVTAKRRKMPKIDTKLVQTFIIQTLQFLLSCVMYLGGTLYLLGYLSAFDRMPGQRRIIMGVAAVLILVMMIGFRRYRKKHPVEVGMPAGALLITFCVVVSLLFLSVGIQNITLYVKDMGAGFQISENVLEDIEVVRNRSRKSVTSCYLKGTDEEGESRSFAIQSALYREWRERIADEGVDTAYITYYTNTQVIYELY